MRLVMSGLIGYSGIQLDHTSIVAPGVLPATSLLRSGQLLKGVFSGHKIMGEMVAIVCVKINSVSFFHYFASSFGGKLSGLIFGTQLSHPKITRLREGFKI